MAWLVVAVLVVSALLAGGYVWRRWIEPWREVDELLSALAGGRAPRKFLMTGNLRATAIGRSLETLADRLQDLEHRVHESEFSVQAVFGAMLDGLVVVDERRRIRMINRSSVASSA